MSDESKKLDEAVDQALLNYENSHPKSLEIHQQACNYMPGGNTRTVIWHEPFPLRIVEAQNAEIVDAEGNRYVDFLGEYTAGLFGHSHPSIQAATREALDGGTNFGAHNHYEARFSQLLCERFPAIERLRFTNSGTEATMMALSVSRYFTGREKVLVFRGGYHGGVFYFGQKNSPINAPFPWIVAPFNNFEATRAIMQSEGDSIACVLVEPMQGSSGCITADPEFLKALRQSCDDIGALLIFDEVMTSRTGAGGAAAHFGVTPDLMTLGKYLGGGHSFGSFGGRADIMGLFDPSRNDALVHAGTFQNNVMTMRNGIEVLEAIYTSEMAEAHYQLGEQWRSGLNRMLLGLESEFQVIGMGSLLCLHPVRGAIRSLEDLKSADDRLRLLLFMGLLNEGYYIARRGFMSLSLLLQESHFRGFENALEKVVRQIESIS